MADENTVGSVSVNARVNLTEYQAGLAQMEASAKATDAKVSAALGNSSAATGLLTQRTKDLVTQMVAAGATEREAAAFFGKTAEAQQSLALFAKLRADAEKAATAATADGVSATNAAAAASQTRLAIDRAALEQLRLKQNLTKQLFGDENSGQKAADAVVTASAALRMRLSKQRVAEAESAAKQEVTAAERAAAQRAQIEGQYFATQLTNSFGGFQNTANRQGAPTSARSSAFATQAPTAAMKDAEKAADDAAKAEGRLGEAGAKTANIFGNSRAIYSETALIHEALSGRWERMIGTASVLGIRAGALSAIFSPLGIAIGAVGAATIGTTAAMIAYDAAIDKAVAASLGLGAASKLTAQNLFQEGAAAAQVSGDSAQFSRGAVQALANAGQQSALVRSEVASTATTFAALTDQKPKQAVAELAEAFSGNKAAAEKLNEQLSILDSTQLRNVESLAAQGDKTGAANALLLPYIERINAAHQAGIGFGDGLHNIIGGLGSMVDWLGKAGNQLVIFENGMEGAAAAAQKAGQKTVEAQQKIAAQNAILTQSGAALWSTPENQAVAQKQEIADRLALLNKGLDAARDKYGAASAEAKGYALAIAENTHALRTFQSEADKQHAAAGVQAQIAGLKTSDPRRAGLERQLTLIQHGGEVETDAEAQRRAQDAAATAADRAGRATAGHRDAQVSDAAATVANAEGQLKLAQAYLAAGAGAVQADAMRKASEEAQRQSKHGDATPAEIQAEYQRQLALATATAAAEGAKKVLTDENQLATQKRLNDAVAAGTMSVEQAAKALKEQGDLQELTRNRDAATGDTKKALTEEIARETAALRGLTAEELRASVQSSTAEQNAKNKQLATELSLIGASNRERDLAIAKEKVLGELKKAGISPTSATGSAAVTAATAGANGQSDLQNAQFVAQNGQSLTQQVQALRDQAAAFGMSRQKAAEFLDIQKALEEAEAQHIDLTAKDVTAIKAQAEAAAEASTQLQKLTDAQKGAAQASQSLADTFESGIEGMIFDGKSFAETARSIAMSLGKETLQGALTGQGPFAALMGTNQVGANGVNGGVLSQLFGSAVGSTGLGGRPTGTPTDPIYTASAMGSGGLSSLLGGGGGMDTGTTGVDLSSYVAGLHTGTNYVGTPSYGRAASPSLFIGAPRLHSGLAPDEFPAILQRGERVVPRGGNRSSTRGVTIHVHAQDAGSFGRTQSQIARETKRSMSRV